MKNPIYSKLGIAFDIASFVVAVFLIIVATYTKVNVATELFGGEAVRSTVLIIATIISIALYVIGRVFCSQKTGVLEGAREGFNNLATVGLIFCLVTIAAVIQKVV